MNDIEINRVLQSIEIPGLKHDVSNFMSIAESKLIDNSLFISIQVFVPSESITKAFEPLFVEAIQKESPEIQKVSVNFQQKITGHKVQSSLKTIKSIKNIIAVASGKGGVGKSTTSVNLAIALAQEGANVGILDADIYGPNQPHMLGIKQRPETGGADKSLNPVEAHGIQSMSIGYLIEQDQAVIWRGPMVTGALQQLLNDTKWQDLDYLIVDLPPGTGDVQLTMAQKIPVSGAVIVTTPQDIALLDARKAIAMFNKVAVPTLGVIENMSGYQCSQCGHEEHIFGVGGGQELAEKYSVDYLGHLPLDLTVRQQADAGVPIVVSQPDSPIAKSYRNMALAIATNLALQSKDYSSKFPNIVIE